MAGFWADGMHTREAAKRMGIGESTLRRMRAKGGGPSFVRVGGRIVYFPAAVSHWLEMHEVQRSAFERAAS